jgi:arylmalonate decarboxylase
LKNDLPVCPDLLVFLAGVFMYDLGTRGRIGLILPSLNTVAEPEMNLLRPEGVTVHAARVPIPGDISTLEAFVRMCEAGCRNAAKAVRELATARVDVYAFAFTAGSFFKGAGWDGEIARQVEEIGQAPCVVTSTAAVDALRTCGVKRVSIVSPYAVGNGLLKKFFNEKGLEVVKMEGLEVQSAEEEGRQTLDTFRRLVERADAPEAEAIFVSCTNFAALAGLDALEKRLGKILITANQATFWAALRHLGIPDQVPGYGRLLREH